MSKPKRRSMRRLKRTLGVTAIILALLIAAIPDMGEAAQKPGTNGNVYELMTESLTYNTTGQLNLDVSNFAPNANGGNPASNSDFRISMEELAASHGDIMPAWYYDDYYEYNIDLKIFDQATSDAWQTAHPYDPSAGVYDSQEAYDAAAKTAGYIAVAGKWDYNINFSYEGYFPTPSDSRRYIASVYYYDIDQGRWIYQSVNGQSGSTTASQLGNAEITSSIGTNLDFTVALSGVNSVCQICVFLNSHVEPDLYIDSSDPHLLPEGETGLDRIFFSNLGTTGTPSRTTAFSMPADESITLGDGLREMYVPAEQIKLLTAPIAAANATALGIDADGGNIVGSHFSNYEDPKVQLLEAFSVTYKDGTGNTAQTALGTGIDRFHRHTMYISLPLDLSQLNAGYRAFSLQRDKIQVLYKDPDGNWHGETPTAEPRNDGDYLTVEFNVTPTVQAIALVVERAANIFVTDNERGSTDYQSIVDSYAPVPTSELQKSWYVRIRPHDQGGDYNSIIRATAGQMPQYTDDDYVNRCEVIKIHTSENPNPTASDATYQAYRLTIGVDRDWRVSSVKNFYVYHKKNGGTGTFADATYWEQVSVTENLNNTYGPYISFDVQPSNGDVYVLYYQALKDTGNGSIDGKIDMRDDDGHTGYAENGFQAYKQGQISGGSYIVAIKDKLSNFWIDDTLPELSEYQSEKYHYDIYLTKQYDEDTDYSGEVTFAGNAKIEITLPLPASWQVSRSNVKLMRAHREANGTISVEPIQFSVNGNKVIFTSNKFSEYAAYYHNPDGERSETEKSQLICDTTNCSPFSDLSDADAWTSKRLGTTSWKLVFSGVDSNTARTAKEMISSHASLDLDKMSYCYPFYLDLQVSTDNGSTWTTVDREDVATVLGNDTINVYLPLPTDFTYSNGEHLKVYGVDPDGTNVSKRVQANETSRPKDYNNVSKGYITFVIDGSKNDISVYDPYDLVYMPNGSGPTPGPTPSGDMYPLRVDDSDCTLTTYAGGASSPTEIDGQQWVVLVKDDFDDTAVIKSKLADIDSAHAASSVVVYPYDIRLLYDNGTQTEVSAADYDNTEITLTIPFPRELQNNYKSGDSVEFFEVYRSGRQLAKQVLDNVTIDTSAKTVTFTTNRILSCNPYAIVHLPQGKLEPEMDEIAAIAWPNAVEMPDTNLDTTVDFMGYSPDKQPIAGTNAPHSEKWKVLLSQYTPDSTAESTEIANKIKAADKSQSIYVPVRSETSESATTGTSTSKTTTTTTKVQEKSVIKVYNLELWENDNGAWSKVSNDQLDRTNDIGVKVTFWLDGSLVGNKGKAKIFTLDPESNNRLESLTGAIPISGELVEASFTTYHFSQYAIVYTPDLVTTTKTDSQAVNGSSSSTGSSSGSSGNSSNSNSSNSSSGSSGSTNGSTNNSGGTGSGGGGNRAGGDNSVDMPRTADATTYKAIFILILLAFGAFELISSMPAKKKATVRAEK